MSADVGSEGLAMNLEIARKRRARIEHVAEPAPTGCRRSEQKFCHLDSKRGHIQFLSGSSPRLLQTAWQI